MTDQEKQELKEAMNYAVVIAKTKDGYFARVDLKKLKERGFIIIKDKK